jgi:hypothetical protein
MIRVYNSPMPLPPEQALLLRDNGVRSPRTEQLITQTVIEAIPLNGAFDFSNPGRPAGPTTSAEIARWYAAKAGG